MSTAKIRESVRNRFVQLQQQLDLLVSLMNDAEQAARARDRANGIADFTTKRHCSGEFAEARTKALGLISFFGTTPRLAALAEEIRALNNTVSDSKRLAGIVRALADEYSTGFLDSMMRQAEAEIAANYLGQAEGLLAEGQSGKFDHVPAAVLAGAVLERSLRDLCSLQTPPVVTVTPKGDPKTLNPIIDDLKKAGVYNELKAKQLRAWADIRNAAAHGEFERFGRGDVEQMLKGIVSFLADFT